MANKMMALPEIEARKPEGGPDSVIGPCKGKITKQTSTSLLNSYS
jgi:hypothetical protein